MTRTNASGSFGHVGDFKSKGKVTLFNVGSSFSYKTGINGSRRCTLYPPLSVSAPFYWFLRL